MPRKVAPAMPGRRAREARPPPSFSDQRNTSEKGDQHQHAQQERDQPSIRQVSVRKQGKLDQTPVSHMAA